MPDRADAQPRPLWRRALFPLVVTVGLALSVPFGMRLGRLLRDSGGGLDLSGWEKATVGLCCLGAMFVVLLVHELGHLIGGRLVGFRAFLLIVGPFRFERAGSGWQLALNRSVGLAGGMAGSAPRDAERLLSRTAVMVAGGPVASVLLAVAGLAGWVATAPDSLGAESSFLLVLASITLLTLGGTSAAIVLVTLLPTRTGSYLTDGARLRLLLRGGAEAERDAAIQALLGASLAGTRPRDWPPSLVAKAQQLEDNSQFELMSWQMAQLQAADQGRADEARAWLTRVLDRVDQVPAAMQAGIVYDAARQLAMGGEVDEARRVLALGSGPAFGAPYLKPLAEVAVAVAVAEGADDKKGVADRGALLEQVALIEGLLDAAFDVGGARYLQDCLAELRAAIAHSPG